MPPRLFNKHCDAVRHLPGRPANSSIRCLSSTHTLASAKASGPEIYDVVCVGGGPAGLALLSALRSSPRTAGLKIALIEGQTLAKSQSTHGSNTSTYSNRCSSLTPGSVKFLKDIGAWQHVNTSRTQPYHSMQVWDGVSGSRIGFDPEETAGNSIVNSLLPRRRAPPADYTVATMTENPNLTSGLLSRLTELSSVETLDKTRVEDISLGEETESLDLRSWPIVSLSGTSRKLAARLLVGADGANSPVRTFADIPSRGWDYDRHGVVASLTLSGPGWGGHDHKTAYQRFLPTGPIALLPLPDNSASLVWSTTPAFAAKLKSLSPEDFVAMVNAAFRLLPVDLEYMLTHLASGHAAELEWRERNTSFSAEKIPQRVVSVTHASVASFPLKMRHADTYIGERVALIGDAAHTVHPLAGQGLNQGLADAQALAGSVAHATGVGWDIGSSWALEAYNAEQWAKNNAVLGTVDKLHKLYSAGSGPVVWARSLGLDAVERLGWVKGLLMRGAGGTR